MADEREVPLRNDIISGNIKALAVTFGTYKCISRRPFVGILIKHNNVMPIPITPLRVVISRVIVLNALIRLVRMRIGR